MLYVIDIRNDGTFFVMLATEVVCEDSECAVEG